MCSEVDAIPPGNKDCVTYLPPGWIRPAFGHFLFVSREVLNVINRSHLPRHREFCPQHWQSIWEQSNPEFVRVPQRDWDNPVCDEWASVLETTVQHIGSSIVVVAHSLGCLAVAHWAKKAHSPIKAALLVSVPDPEGRSFPVEAVGFAPLPNQRFSFPSIIVASTDDPFGSLVHAQRYASAWGSHLVNIGKAGHVNADSGLGRWEEGYAMLQQLCH